MIRVTHLSEDGQTLVSGDERLLDHPGLKWVDVEGPTEANLLPLADRFGIHRLAVEDCLHLDQRPKLEEYPNHLLIVLHGFSAEQADPAALTMHELHFLLGKDFVITVHELPNEAIADALRRFQTDPAKTFGRGADFIAYAVADALVDRNFPLIDAFQAEIEGLEEQVFEYPVKEQLQRIFALKRSLVDYRKVLSPQRDVVSALARNGLDYIQHRTTLYFRDIYDHLVRVYEGLEASREMLANARDAWVSSMSNRTNDVSKQLTVVATIFLPLSFVTGFFGQNFEVLSSAGNFWIMLVSVFAIPLLMMAWFRYKGWS